MSFGGHLRTVLPRLRHALAPVPAPPAQPWTAVVDDPKVGPVQLRGRFSAAQGAGGRGPLVLLVHGLGGSAESHYMRRAAAGAVAAGWSCLRVSLRGSECDGEDYYHAALTADLHAALASPELAGHAPLFVFGFSLGGHLALRLAAEAADPRLAAVAAVASPLDLARGADAFDAPGRALYRAYVMGSLKRIYAAVAARREVPLAPEAARRIRFIREWDERVVAPRHGFAGAADYYRRASVAAVLGELRLPALLVAAEDDPMVPAAALLPALEGAPAGLEVRWLAAGGHLGFGRELEPLVLGWLERHLG